VNGFMAILVKELAHLRRERTTIFFALIVPMLQLTIFGFAINTRIEHIRTVVFNQDGRDDSRALVEALANTRTFRIVEHVQYEEDFRRALTSGRAKVGVRIPPDYTDALRTRRQGIVQVLIDGSDSQAAQAALNTTNLLGFRESLRMALPVAEAAQVGAARNAEGGLAVPVEMRPRLLFNPDLKSSHFFVPALVGIIMQLVTLFLTAFTIVREREQGTLEQLFVTPVGRLGLMLGKLLPYAGVGMVSTLTVLLVMVFVFGVPIRGSVWLLLGLSLLFLVTSLGLGLLVSTLARTQVQAIQAAFIIMLPSILLSGFMFPREGMPLPIYVISAAIPVTHFLEILRGVILRDADLIDLAPHIAGLSACCVVVLSVAVLRFRKQLE
jgi:ribosome-dependent ATPase